MTVQAFYDDLAPLYHLVYNDWPASVERQGAALAALIAERWGAGARTVLDAALGIGTQALGLAGQGFSVTGSDVSHGALARARVEARRRNVSLPCCVADLRALASRTAGADVVLVCDNALPHLTSDADIRCALAECYRSLRPSGGCIVSVRDYGPAPPSGTVQMHSYGEREWEGRRYRVIQRWAWKGPHYDLTFEFDPIDHAAGKLTISGATYFAIPISRLLQLMTEVGFMDVQRLDGVLFQPVLVGTCPVA
jgi:SAM-dependent methyltransferase